MAAVMHDDAASPNKYDPKKPPRIEARNANINELDDPQIRDIISHIVEAALAGTNQSKNKVMIMALGPSLNGKSTSIKNLIVPGMEKICGGRPRDINPFVDMIRKGYIFQEYQELVPNLTDRQIMEMLLTHYPELAELIGTSGIATACIDFGSYALPRTRYLLQEGHGEAVHQVYTEKAPWEPWNLLKNTVFSAIDQQKPIIIDSTGSRLEYIEAMLEKAKEHGYTTVMLILNCDMSKIFERANKRNDVRELDIGQVIASNTKTAKNFNSIVRMATENDAMIAVLDTTNGYQLSAVAGSFKKKQAGVLKTVLDISHIPEARDPQQSVHIIDVGRFRSFIEKADMRMDHLTPPPTVQSPEASITGQHRHNLSMGKD